MRKLAQHFSHLCDRNRDNNPQTQHRRRRELDLIARQLKQLGYHHLQSPAKIGNRHITALINLWLHPTPPAEPLSPGTVKNRLASLRWALEKVGRGDVMLKTNDAYLVPRREYVATESKAQDLDLSKLSEIQDPYIVMSLRLQAAFGLRRQAAIKFMPSVAYAPGQDHIYLKSTWTKGGRERTVPITTDEQRILLAEASALAGSGSLIPSHLRFVDQLHQYERWCSKVGLHKMHGLRHAYAQDRYTDLSGLTPPVLRVDVVELTADERERDTAARLEVSKELGHSRESITGVYIGAKRNKLKTEERGDDS